MIEKIAGFIVSATVSLAFLFVLDIVATEYSTELPGPVAPIMKLLAFVLPFH